MKRFLIAVTAFLCALMGFVAVACEKTEMVTFQFDTRCEQTIEDASVKKGEEFTLPTPQSRGKEWEFGGWYLNPEFTGDAVTSVVADTDTTFYAKWEQLYKLNLNLNGGTLAGANDIYLKQGTVLSTYLANYIPQKEKHQFGRWMNGTSALNDAFRMPASAVTLTAEYKVAYTIDVWTKSLAYLEDPTAGHAEYEKETITQYAYVKDFRFDYAPYGLRSVDTTPAGYPDIVNDGELKDDPEAGDNHFVLYFDRLSYTVRLSSNVANGGAQIVEFNYYYDQVFELPYDLFTNVGYVFAGWSETPSGGNDYPIDFIDAVLYNKQGGDESEVKREKEYRVKGEATLYAYWNKGYSDLFGAQDTIFLLDETAKEIYLFRGGKYFKGTYNANYKEFTFRDKSNKTIFTGKILDENTFCYSDISRTEIHAQYFTYEVNKPNDKIRLDMDEFNGVKYTETDENGNTHVASGTYKYDLESGEFTAYFESGEGELVGRTVHFILGTYNKTRIFLIRNEAEYELGTLPRLVVTSGGVLNSYRLPLYSLTFTGYGYGVYYNGTSPMICYYTYNSEMNAYVVKDANARLICNARLVNEGGISGYMAYSPVLDDEFEGEGGSLIMDGLMHATFVSGSTAISGYYTLQTSYFTGYVVSLTSNGTTYSFLLEKHEEGKGDDMVTYYTMSQKPAGYAEYLYYIGGTVLGQDVAYRPMLVMNDERVGQASFYDRVSGKYVKAATGTYEYDETSKLYTLTGITAIEDVDHSGSMFDVSELSEMMFALDTTSTSYRIYYVYSFTDLQNDTTRPVKEYKPALEAQQEAEMELLIVGGLAVFKDGTKATYIGKYVTRNGITQITAFLEGSYHYIYVELTEGEDGQDGTFIKLDSAPFKAELYREDGTRYSYEYLIFDGKGGVTYTYRNDESKSVTVTGTFKEVGKLNTAPIYLFTEADQEEEPLTFRYILITDGTNMYFSKISPLQGTYTSALGTLELDGTGFTAKFTDLSGNTYLSQYRVRVERENGLTVIYMYANGQYLYFEVDPANSTFRRIGSELGTYLIMDNQYLDGRYVELDGDGNFTLYQMTTSAAAEADGEEEPGDEDSGSEMIAQATYKVNEDGTVTLTYTDNTSGVDTPVTMIGRLGALQIGNYIYSVFVIQYNSIADTYVNEKDYSVVVLNDTGIATRYLSSGKKETGSYTLITDTTLGADYNMLYYVSNDGTDATIYEYDTVNKLIWRVENSDRAFFSSDLSSLRFTRYGFAVFNGTTRYYYHQKLNGNGIVTGYTIFRASREAIDGKMPNKYGFIEYEVEIVGGRTIELNEVAYYDNGGFNITFNRETDTAENYPITVTDENDKTEKYNLTSLTFSPSGNTEFSVSGTVKVTRIGDDESFAAEMTYNCTVVRRLLEQEEGEEGEPKYEMYFMISNFRFDIEIDYDTMGTNKSSYNISRMRFYLGLYNYWDIYNLAMQGSTPFFGFVTIERDYDTAGEASEDGFRMSGQFGLPVQLIDANGEILNFEEMPCERSGSGYIVTVDHQEQDGYIYKGVISLTSLAGISVFNMVFYREQEFAYGEDYTVVVGRIVSSTVQNYAPGNLAVLGIKDSEGNDLTDVGVKMNDDWYVITREYSEVEEGSSETPKIVSTTYFKIELEERDDLPDEFQISENIKIPLIKPYKSATVTKTENIKTYYTADGKSYVDIDAENNVLLYCRNGQYYYAASESVYYEGGEGEEPYYIMTMSSGDKYKITLKDEEEGEGKYVVVEKYVDPEEKN